MRASGYERADNDWYVEDRKVVEGLVAAEVFTGHIYDPACGSGNIPKTFASAGYTVYASDIADRGYGATGHDFLSMSNTAENIVSNPPYNLLEPFIYRALEATRPSGGKVAFLTRLAFLEGVKRQSMFRSTPLARLWISSRRVSMPPGHKPEIKAKGGTIAYAWLVWDHAHSGRPTFDWI